MLQVRYPVAHSCYNGPVLCHFKGFKLALTSTKAARHHGGHEFFGMYKTEFDRGFTFFRPGSGGGWTTVEIGFGEMSSDWSDFTGLCTTADPDGYQHQCCSRSGTPQPGATPDVCPSEAGLANLIGLSIWSEGVEGNFALEIKSISVA